MLIYLLTNTVNGKQYVGQTIRSLKDRLYHHRWDSTKKRGYILHKAIAKHGWDAFTSEVLKYCSSKEELDAEEKRYITTLNTLVPKGYNWALGGESAGPHTEESKLKMSIQRKGRPAHEKLKSAVAKANSLRVVSEETHKKLSDSQKGNTKALGKPRPKEVKEKIGVAQRGDKNHAAKLTWPLVEAIRFDYANGIKVVALSRKYLISHANISRIVNFKMWLPVDKALKS